MWDSRIPKPPGPHSGPEREEGDTNEPTTAVERVAQRLQVHAPVSSAPGAGPAWPPLAVDLWQVTQTFLCRGVHSHEMEVTGVPGWLSQLKV